MKKSVGKLFLTIILSIFFFERFTYAYDPICDLKETSSGFYQQHCKLGDINNLQGGRRLPESKILDITPVKNQNPLGTCVSFTAGACVEYYFPKVYVSEAEFTILAETHLPEGDCVAGLSLGHALHLANRMGFVKEDKLSYRRYLKYVAWLNEVSVEQLEELSEDAPICKKNSNYSSKVNYNNIMDQMKVNLQLKGNYKEDITPYGIGKLYPIFHTSPTKGITSIPQEKSTRLEMIKRALNKDMPVAAGINVFNDYLAVSNNIITLPSEYNEFVGNHAVMLYGYNDTLNCFNLKNSWGNNWGNEGTAYIPYEYITNYAFELVAVEPLR